MNSEPTNEIQLLSRRDAIRAMLLGTVAVAVSPALAWADGETDGSDTEAAPNPELAFSVVALGSTTALHGLTNQKLGSTSGKTELAKLSASISNCEDGGITYRAFFKEGGWKNGKDGETVSSKGEPIHAITFALTGALAQTHSIYYRVYIKNKGWLGWAKDGGKAGASKETWRSVKALQLKLQPKAEAAPGAAKGALLAPATKNSLLATLDKAGEKRKLQLLGGGSFDFSSKKGKRLKKAIKAVESVSEGGVLSFCMIDLTTGEGVSYAGKRKIYGASCMKGPYIASLNKYRPKTRQQRGGDMREIVVESDNALYLNLRRNVYGSKTMKKFMKYCKVKSWSSGMTYPFVPCKDLSKMWVGCYWYFYKETNKNSKWCRELYTHGNQSFIYQAFKGTYKVHAKPGWSPGFRGNVQNDSGIVMANGKPYLVTVMSGAADRFSQLRELCRALDAVHSEMAK